MFCLMWRKRNFPSDLVSTQVGTGPEFMVRMGAREGDKWKGEVTSSVGYLESGFTIHDPF